MASEKELNIKVTSQTEVSSIESLVTLLEDIKTKAEELQTSLENIQFDGTDVDAGSVSDSLSDASSSADDLVNSLGGIDGSGLDDVASMGSDVSDSLSDASSSTEDLSGSLNSIDSETIRQLSSEVDELKEKLKETQQETGNTTTTLDDLAGLASNTAIVAGYKSMADEAGAYGDTMVRLGYAMSGTSMTVEQAEQTYGGMIKSMTTSTGRGAGMARQHILNLANVGVKNNKTLQESFDGISKASFQMGQPMEQMDSAFQKMVLSGMAGKRQLSNFGISAKILGKAMGVSADEATKKFKELDENTRASVLSSALNMKYGEGVTNNYKNSYQRLGETVDRAKDYFERLVGKVLLPYLVPAIENGVELINWLADAFDGLPAPLKGAIGGLATLSAGFSALAVGGSVGIRIAKSLYEPYKLLGGVLTDLPGNINNFTSSISNGLSTTKGKITDFASTIKNKLPKGGFWGDEKGSLGGGDASGTFDTLKTKVSNVVDSVKARISSMTNSIRNGMNTAKTKVMDFTSSLKTTLVNGFNTAKTKAVEFATTLKTNIIGALSNVKTRIIGLATTLKTTLVTAFNGAVTKAKELALGLLDLGKKALISGYNALKSAGMWLVEKASLIASAIGKGIATASSWALAVAEWAVASPILIIVGLVLILIGVLIYLYMTNENVRNTINGLGQTFIEIGQMIYNAMMNAVNTVISYLNQLWNYIVGIGQWILSSVGITGNSIMASVLGFIVFMATLPLQLGVILTNAIARLLGFKGNFVQTLLSTAVNGVKNFVGNIGGMANKLRTELQNMLSVIGEWAKTLPDKFWQAGVNAVKQFLSALGINSPGIMQRIMEWEITEMGNRVPKQSEGLISNVTKMGTSVVDSFGEPKLGIGIEDNIKNTISNLNLNGLLNIDNLKKNDLYTNDNNEQIINATTEKEGQSKTFNINIEVGTVDNEDRVNEIVDAVKKTLMFENSTAGRGV